VGGNCLPMAKFMRHSYGFPHFRGKSLSTIFLQRDIRCSNRRFIAACAALENSPPIVERENARSRCNQRNLPLRIKFGERLIGS